MTALQIGNRIGNDYTIALPGSQSSVYSDAILPFEYDVGFEADMTVTAASSTYTTAAGWSPLAVGNTIDFFSFVNPGNNGRKRVISISGTNMVVASTSTLVNETGIGITGVRVSRMPSYILVTGNSATTGKFSLGLAGESKPANDSTFIFAGAGIHHIIKIGSYSIVFWTSGAGVTATVTSLGNS